MTCKICGEEDCKKHSILFSKARSITEFSGSSPPEIFVGKWNYPNVYTGILSPESHGNTEILSSSELWHEKKLPISNILSMRNQLIYGRTQSNIFKPRSQTDQNKSKFLETMQEVAMTEKSISAEYKLKKPISKNEERESSVPLISNAAQVESIRLEENPSVLPKVDYLVNDTDVKSTQSLQELHKANIPTSSLVKLLSAGLLGLKKNRKLVPTRWSITAVDDTLSKNILSKVKAFQEISDILVFHATYIGNNYNFLLLPSEFAFEVIEISLKNMSVWHDSETFFPRKKYADSVTGAYYANRLALCEYLEKINRQASCLVIREIRQEYYAPLGVGILRQISREAFLNQPNKFSTLQEAFQDIQSRLKQPITNYISRSLLLKNQKTQTKLSRFF